MSDAHSYDDYRTGVGDNLLSRLSGLALEQKQAEAEVERLEEELRLSKQRLSQIAEHELPALMEEAEVEEFSTKDGIKISVKEVIRGSVPKAGAAQAFAWLEANGHGNLIKRQFTIDFGRDQEDWAKEFGERLEADTNRINYKLDRKVVPQTLQAFVREQLEEGVEFPMELFGVFRQRSTKVEVK